MKPVGTSVPQSAGNLLPGFAAKEDASGDSFQAALAQALLSGAQATPASPPVLPVSAEPLVPEIHPTTMPEPRLPVERPTTAGQTGITPGVPAIPLPAHPIAKVPPRPIDVPETRPVDSPVAIFEPRPMPRATEFEPFVEKPASRPSVFPAAHGSGREGSHASKSAAVSMPAAQIRIEQLKAAPPVHRVLLPEQRETTVDVVQVPPPPTEQATPLPIPLAPVPTLTTPRLKREDEVRAKTPTSASDTSPKTRTSALQVGSSPTASRRPAPLEALLGSPAPAPAQHDDNQDTAPVERIPTAAKVTIEELHVESTAAPAVSAAVKDKSLAHSEPPKREVEPIAVSSRGDSVPTQGRPIANDSSVHTTEAPIQSRHLDEAPRPSIPTDRVTLRLPDDAGGGRLQIAVRGDVVHARIIDADSTGTREMTAGLDELRTALTRQGFQEAHVRIDSRPAVTEGGWMTAAAGRESAGAGDNRSQDSQSQDRRERHPDYIEDRGPDPRQQPDRRSQQRSRRERER